MWRGGAVEGALARALRLAGNQAIREAQKATVERITSKKWLREDFVKKGLPLTVPKGKASLSSMEWVERVSGKPIELSRFPHIQTAFGVNVRVNKGSGTARIRSAFIADNVRGHESVFLRRGKARLPIKELHTTRLCDAMSDQDAMPSVERKAMARFDSAFARGLEREMGKLRRKGDI